MNKVCTKCKVDQPVSSYHKKKNGLFGVKAVCKTCTVKEQSHYYNIPANKEKRLKRQASDEYQLYIREFRLEKQYGITLEQYDQILAAQNGGCAICSTTVPGGSGGRYFAVDHNHLTGKVRQLLCSSCNTALGYVKDNINTLEKMIDYLKKHE